MSRPADLQVGYQCRTFVYFAQFSNSEPNIWGKGDLSWIFTPQANFTFFEPCILIYLCNNQQNSHFFYINVLI